MAPKPPLEGWHRATSGRSRGHYGPRGFEGPRAARPRKGHFWDGLWLIDNYESILQALTAPVPTPMPDSSAPADEYTEAQTIHHLLGQMANGGARLLITSRELPTQFRGEVLYPGHDQPSPYGPLGLQGLDEASGKRLFFEKSSRAMAPQWPLGGNGVKLRPR